MKKALNVRQERFCELIAAGEVPADAWINAGHKVSRNVAKSAANRSLTNVDLRSRIAELRKPQTKKALLSRDRKREILAEIAIDSTATRSDRIRAMEVDAKLAGHFEPDRVEVEAGPKTLLSIKERAAQVSSALARRYGNE